MSGLCDPRGSSGFGFPLLHPEGSSVVLRTAPCRKEDSARLSDGRIQPEASCLTSHPGLLFPEPDLENQTFIYQTLFTGNLCPWVLVWDAKILKLMLNIKLSSEFSESYKCGINKYKRNKFAKK